MIKKASYIWRMIPFIKMHGCGNDFVIVDCREDTSRFTPAMAALMADRQFGIGCDQVIVLENIIGSQSAQDKTAIFMRIYNADGSESDACGNATRCVAWLLMEEQGVDESTVVTNVAEIQCERMGHQQVRVNMGEPKVEWNEIPLAQEADTLHLPMSSGMLRGGVGVNMGNPHAVFIVDDLDAADIETHGSILEHDALLPERGNISVAQVLSRSEVKARVWERGSGLTLACGTGACAIAVSLIRRELVDRKCMIHLPGGSLEIEWCDEHSEMPNHVLMSGPVAEVFCGKFNAELSRT